MKNILFVCIGNSCRSQMAEGFARAYGSDVMYAWSAGLAPASIVQPLTISVMDQKNIDIRDQFPKSIFELELNAFELVVNMSARPIPALLQGDVWIWNVDDPMAQSEETYVRVRNQIEGLVMKLVMDLRRESRNSARLPIPKPPKPAPAKPANVAVPQRFGFGRVRRDRDSN